MVDQWSLTADWADYDYSSTEFTLKISTSLLLGEYLCIVVLFDGGSVVVYYRQIKTADFTLESERFCCFRDSSVSLPVFAAMDQRSLATERLRQRT